MKADKKVMGIKWMVGIIFAAAFMIIAGPIVINELYKHEGYRTMWSCADMLSYYGGILGAGVAVATLAVTIRFTKKQVQREAYLQSEKEKWSKIEEVLINVLRSLNPYGVMRELIKEGQQNPVKAIALFQEYQLSCLTVKDEVSLYMGKEENARLQELLCDIEEKAGKLAETADKGIQAYSKLRDAKGRKAALEKLEAEKATPGAFSEEELSACRIFLDNTNEVEIASVFVEVEKIAEELDKLHDGVYASLLETRKDVFNQIYADIQKQADNILRL